MQQVDGDRALVDAVLLASRALVGVAARSLADVDEVTLPQFRALVLIGSRPGTTVSDLAGALSIHPTSATRLCDRLVRKRFIRRIESATDRRRTELHLAAGGQRLVDRVTRRRRLDLAAIAGRMQGEVEAAAAVFANFAEAAGEWTPEAELFGWEPGEA